MTLLDTATFDREPTAAELVDQTRAVASPACELAVLLCCCAKVERSLLRTVRLRVTAAGLDAEPDLWNSPLVALRGVDGLTFRTDVLDVLRADARRALAGGGPFVHRQREAWSHILQAHESAPALIKLEERLAWESLQPFAPDPEIDLRQAIAAIVDEQRNGVARWAARALPAMPPSVRRTTAAWQLAQVAASVTGAEVAVEGPTVVTESAAAAVVEHLGQTRVGVRRVGDVLELGVTRPGSLALDVVGRWPLQLTLTTPGILKPADVRSRLVRLRRGESVSVAAGWVTHTLTDVAGNSWQLEGGDERAAERDAAPCAVMLSVEGGSPDEPSTVVQMTCIAAGCFATLAPRSDVERPSRKRLLHGVDLGRAGWVIPADLRWVTESDGVNVYTSATARPNVGPMRSVTSIQIGEPAYAVEFGADGDRFYAGSASLVVEGVLPDGRVVARGRSRHQAAAFTGTPMISDGRLVGLVTETDADDGWLTLTAAPLGALASRAAALTAGAPTSVDVLPADHGTAILVTWTDGGGARRDLLFDTGPGKAAARLVRQRSGGHVDALILSHLDSQATGGLAEVIETIDVGQVILPDSLWDTSGGHALTGGQRLSALQSMSPERVFPVPPLSADGPLPLIELPGGARVTILSPTDDAALRFRSSRRERGQETMS